MIFRDVLLEFFGGVERKVLTTCSIARIRSQYPRLISGDRR